MGGIRITDESRGKNKPPNEERESREDTSIRLLLDPPSFPLQSLVWYRPPPTEEHHRCGSGAKVKSVSSPNVLLRSFCFSSSSFLSYSQYLSPRFFSSAASLIVSPKNSALNRILIYPYFDNKQPVTESFCSVADFLIFSVVISRQSFSNYIKVMLRQIL